MSKFKLKSYYGKKITLCGSTKFKKDFKLVNMWLSLNGILVYSLPCFSQSDGHIFSNKEINALEVVQYNKIDSSMGLFVIDVDGYIGEGTKKEIEFAKDRGKYVHYLSETLEEYEDWKKDKIDDNKK